MPRRRRQSSAKSDRRRKLGPRLQDRVLRLLREQPSRALPLHDLHRAIAADGGPAVGSYTRFANELARHHDLFVVIEPRDPLGAPDDWPADLRAVYSEALRAAGLDREPRVALANPSTPGGVDGLRAAERSLVELWVASAEDPIRRARLADAIVEVEAMRRALRAYET